MANESEMKAPATFLQAVRFFADEEEAIQFLADVRWSDGEQVCPKCGTVGRHYWLKNQRRWRCREKACRRQFSIKVGTIFEDSPIGLDKWLTAMWMVANCKNGVSSWEMHRALGVTQKTAWFMLHRIRLALQDEGAGKLGGEVEVDETYIGGKARNMHASRRRKLAMKTGRGETGKTVVMGILERKGNVRGAVVADVKKRTLQPHIYENVEPGTSVYTDEFNAYMGLEKDFEHGVINHAEKYVDGQIHTNGMENFWSLLKRGLHGTYVSVEPFHLFRYLDEQMFRYNHRKDIGDAGRFDLAVQQIVGKRLTYAEVTGKVGETISH